MTVNGVGGTNGAQYQYDVLGNIRQKQEGASSLTLTYWTLNHAIPPHEVLGVSGSQTLVFAYDANGNQCAVGASLPQGCSTAGASQYKFDAENRVTSRTDSTGGNDTYVYGGQGTLLKRTMNDGTGNSAWTVYIGGA